MRILRLSAPLALLCVAGLAAAEGGLKVQAAGGFWSDMQTKLRFSAVVLESSPALSGYPTMLTEQDPAPLGASFGGDYFFSKDPSAGGRPLSGFRASGAVLIRQPGVSLSDLAWQSRATASLASPLRLGEPGNQGLSAMPYLGIGYSDYSLKTGWGFWADIGLVVQSPGNALGMGRVLSGTQSVDDLVRELRLSPMLQLGVNYSF
ncbi:MAG: hypothetical protein H6R06_291 [Proteobacteria bacterium]|jgi:hypothetical protein|nr:hypothetical protein [Pseudomonadota bacterium]